MFHSLPKPLDTHLVLDLYFLSLAGALVSVFRNVLMGGVVSCPVKVVNGSTFLCCRDGEMFNAA